MEYTLGYYFSFGDSIYTREEIDMQHIELGWRETYGDIPASWWDESGTDTQWTAALAEELRIASARKLEWLEANWPDIDHTWSMDKRATTDWLNGR